MLRAGLSWTALPFLLIVLVATAFIAVDPLGRLRVRPRRSNGSTVERIVLDEAGISLRRARRRLGTGADRAGAGRCRVLEFHPEAAGSARPPRAAHGCVFPIPGSSARAHQVKLRQPHRRAVSSTPSRWRWRRRGLLAPAARQLFACIGLFVGVVPVGLGMLFYPALRRGGPRPSSFRPRPHRGAARLPARRYAREGLEVAGEARGRAASRSSSGCRRVSAFAALTPIGRRGGEYRKRERRWPPLIALGIGLHNLGEGLAIGAAYATGAAALGSFLRDRLHPAQRHRGRSASRRR